MATNFQDESIKNVYISFPEDPNPENIDHEFHLYTRNIFLQTVHKFISCLGKQKGIKTISRSPRSSEKVKSHELTDKIENSDCVIIVCCPAVVHLLSNLSPSDSRLEENQFFLELNTIRGHNITQNRFRIIPVFLNTSSDSLHKSLPAELGTTSVSVCVTTIPECTEELWPAQQSSIEKLLKVIRVESVFETPSSLGTEIDAIDEEWCLHFIDQFAIDFISCVFEERNIHTDNFVIEKFLQIESSQLKSFRELLRIWLRRLRQRKVHSVFEEMKLILAEFGREDLMYQLRSQYEFYKEEVYQEQNKQTK